MNTIIRLPTDLKKLVWGFIGYDELEGATGMIMREFNEYHDASVELLDTPFDLKGHHLYTQASLRFFTILWTDYSLQRRLSSKKYPKLDMEVVSSWRDCFKNACWECGIEIDEDDYRDYQYDRHHYCSVCYGLETGMLGMEDASGFHCAECGIVKTVEEYIHWDEYHYRCSRCYYNDETDGETDEEEEEEEN